MLAKILEFKKQVEVKDKILLKVSFLNQDIAFYVSHVNKYRVRGFMDGDLSGQERLLTTNFKQWSMIRYA